MTRLDTLLAEIAERAEKSKQFKPANWDQVTWEWFSHPNGKDDLRSMEEFLRLLPRLIKALAHQQEVANALQCAAASHGIANEEWYDAKAAELTAILEGQ